MNQDTKKIGRPSKYTDETAEEICRLLSNGMTLLSICRLPEMPEMTTVHRWLDSNPDFQSNYAHARKLQADAMAEQVIEEAMSSHDAPIGRLRMDALKWFAAKMAPKRYGDKVEVEQTGQQNFKISFSVPDRNVQDSLANVQPLPAPVPQIIDIQPEVEPETVG